MGKPKIWHEVSKENFDFLKLVEKFKNLTYAEYLEFCTENDEHEICPCEDHNLLGADFVKVIHERGYRTKPKYLLDEISRVKRAVEKAKG
jgi:hypothetical protein